MRSAILFPCFSNRLVICWHQRRQKTDGSSVKHNEGSRCWASPPQLDGSCSQVQEPTVFKWVHLGTPISGNRSPDKFRFQPTRRYSQALAGLCSSHIIILAGPQKIMYLTLEYLICKLQSIPQASCMYWIIRCFHSRKKFCFSVSSFDKNWRITSTRKAPYHSPHAVEGKTVPKSQTRHFARSRKKIKRTN